MIKNYDQTILLNQDYEDFLIVIYNIINAKHPNN